jgi:23S rRNA pseudouridine2605 synthase
MYEVRLQKFLAECGVGSRRKMEQFIKEGRVRVNGQVVTELGRKINPEHDKIEVNRRPVRAAPKGIILLNKPRGVVSTLSDPEGRPTVAEFLTKHYTSYFPVGRLDYDSTGLMILTNDGEMAERLMHPRFGFERVYEARVEGSVAQATLDKLRTGVRLSDGIVEADAAVLRSDAHSTWVQVTIKEGRNRVVRRVFEKLGHPVMKLKRTTYGPFKIGRLQVGQVRVLTLKEFLQVRRKVMTFKPDEGGSTVDARGTESRAPRVDRDERRPQGSGRSTGSRQRGAPRNGSKQGGSRPQGSRKPGSRPNGSRPNGSRQRSGARRRD